MTRAADRGMRNADPGSRMRILFAVSHLGFLRNFESTLALLAERGHSVHLVTDRTPQPGVTDGMPIVERLAARFPGAFTLETIRASKSDRWYAFSTTVREGLNYWRYLSPAFADAPKLRARGRTQAPAPVVWISDLPLVRSRTGLRGLTAMFRALERAIPVRAEIEALFDRLQPDVLLVTPLLYFGSRQVDYVRAARARGISSVLGVGSWDHLTTKGLIHEMPDRMLVWNELQRAEAVDLHGARAGQVVVTGAQAYDHWFATRPSTERDAFCRRVGLPSDRPYLLYLCSSPFIAPYEVDVARRWIAAVRGSGSTSLRTAGILVRPHPQNAAQWADVDLTAHGDAVIWPRAGANPIGLDARHEYYDSMYHSHAVVGVNTSALIESGIAGRLVYSFRVPELSGTQEGTLHFRHLERGGLLQLADTLETHVAQLERSFDSTERDRERVREFIHMFVRPYGLDEPATPRVVSAIEEQAALRPVPRKLPAHRRVSQRVLELVLSKPKFRGSEVPGFRGSAVSKFQDSEVETHEPRNPGTSEPRNLGTSEPRNLGTSDGGAGAVKILFLMDSPEYLRFYDSAIEELAARGHAIAIAVNNQRAKKPVGVEGLRAYGDRVTVLGVVPESTGLWSDVAHGLRAVMDFVRFLHPTFAAAPALRARIKRKVLPRAYHWIDIIPRLGAGAVRRVERALMAAERAIPVCAPIADFLRAQAPDVLLVSPLVAAASEQVDWIKAARACGIRSAVCIASWDNLTNKGLLRMEPDLVIVWNDAQQREAEEYHYIPAGKIAVTGAQLFDKWFEKTASRDRDAFCRRVGLPGSEAFVLFTGSSSFISETRAEVAFVRRWIQALRSSAHPALRAINVLVRPHPYNCHAWEDDPVSDLPGVTVFPRRGYNPIDPENRSDFFDSLYHCAVVVGINTSAMIEAAIVGRPVCSLLAPEFAGTQEGTIHFRHLLPENGGFLRIAPTIERHIDQLGECLRDPKTTQDEIARFVGTFIRPHGIHRPATPIFAETIDRLGRAPAPAPEPAPAWRHLVRPVLLAAALPAVVVEHLRHPSALIRLRKRIDSVARRARKRMARAGARWKRYFEEAW